MSRRAIKRFEQQKLEDPQFGKDDLQHSKDDTDDAQSSDKKQASLFSLLALDDDDDDDNKNSSDETYFQQSIDQQPQQKEGANDAVKLSKADTESERDSQRSSKKKKKKKRKAKKRATNNQQAVDMENDPDWIALNEFQEEINSEKQENEPSGFIPRSLFSPDDGEDVREEARRIMAIVEQMAFPESIIDKETSESSVKAENAQLMTKTLHVEPKLLNADAELKRLFGARVVESERRNEENAAARRRRGMQKTIRRKVSLVSPRETWFDHAPGLIMELDNEAPNSEDVRYFRYSHQGSYARLQEEYRQVVAGDDPNWLVEFCAKHPYHVDGLLQLAELHRQMGELDRAAEQIERCIYILEASWAVSFKPFGSGSCRLRFDVVENRSLYVALFRYSQLLTRRGLHRTSLEISKLLLNLDPVNDPMGMLMLADSYALLSAEYDWVLQVRDAYSHIPVKYFPNFALSSALAVDMRDWADSKRTAVASSSSTTGRRLGSLIDEETKNENKSTQSEAGADAKRAEHMLVDALLTFPMILRPLLDIIGDTSAVWTESRLFDEGWYSAGIVDGGVLYRMSRVYAERSKLLWNSGHAKDLLIRCARIAGRLDDDAGMGMDPKTNRLTSVYVKDEVEHARVARCRAFRIESANWLAESGLYRKVQIADFADSTNNLPAEVLAGDQGTQPIGATQRPREVSVGRGALEFLHSFLPWREAQDARIPGEEH